MAKPVKCARCGRENDPSFAFCLDCGQSLKAAPPPASPAATCAACGAKLQPAFRFCGHCGAPVGATPDRPLATPPPATPPAPLAAPPAPVPAAPPASPVTSPGRPAGARIAAVRSDGLPGAIFPLDQEEIVCGRAEGFIRIPDDATLSPRHARFGWRRATLVVEDLGSVNGTFLRIREPRRLAPGEEFRIGRQLLRLEPLARTSIPDDGVRSWGAPDAGYRFRLSQLLDGGGLGEIFPLRAGENTIGREGGDIFFPSDRYVSARHAVLEVGSEAITLADVGSSNGTFVRIDGPTELANGDQLLVGSQLLRVEL